jgi:hypothetical protein
MGNAALKNVQVVKNLCISGVYPIKMLIHQIPLYELKPTLLAENRVQC